MDDPNRGRVNKGGGSRSTSRNEENADDGGGWEFPSPPKIAIDYIPNLNISFTLATGGPVTLNANATLNRSDLLERLDGVQRPRLTPITGRTNSQVDPTPSGSGHSKPDYVSTTLSRISSPAVPVNTPMATVAGLLRPTETANDYIPNLNTSLALATRGPVVSNNPNATLNRSEMLEREDCVRHQRMTPIIGRTNSQIDPTPSGSAHSKPDNVSTTLNRLFLPAVSVNTPMATIPEAETWKEVQDESDSEEFVSDTGSDEAWKVARQRRKVGFHTGRWHVVQTPGAGPGIPLKFAQLGQVPLIPRIHYGGYSYFAKIKAVTGPDNFYITLLRHRSGKRELQHVIQEMYYAELSKDPMYGVPEASFLVPGLIVVCSLDHSWYRAEILSVVPLNWKKRNNRSQSLYNVLFIDRGDQHRVALSQIRYMSRDLLKYRVKVMKCALDKKREERPWHPTAVARFLEIVSPGMEIKLKYIYHLTSEPRTWGIRCKLNIRGNWNSEVRNVDVSTEIRCSERRESIASMYKLLRNDVELEESDSDCEQVSEVKRIRIFKARKDENPNLLSQSNSN